MTRSWLLVPLLVLGVACDDGPSIPETDLRLTVLSGAQEVAPGRGFPLTVVRIWSKALVPSEWRDASLSPLVLRLEGTTRREDDARIEETRRYRAYAFGLADVFVPAPSFAARPRAGGAEQRVTADGIRVRVKPTVDPEAPGAPEIPDDLLEEPSRWGPLAIAGGLLLALAAIGFLVRRRRLARPAAPAAPPVAPPPEPPDVRSLRALARLRAETTGGPEDLRVSFGAVADVVRGYVGDRLGVRAMERTTEELLGATAAGDAMPPGSQEGLREVLAPCDAVKFANLPPSVEARSRLFEVAERFVRATASGPAAPGAPDPSEPGAPA